MIFPEPYVVGLPWELAEGLLYNANIRYNSIVTHPTKNFFPLSMEYYVIRQKCLDGDIWEITLAARLLKEVSEDGL